MTGWSLIIVLIILGGIISTLGDFLGSKIGKARLSIFKLRPRRTAVLINILTGSLISSLSLMFVLSVNRQLRDGLFRLNDIKAELKEKKKEKEILEKRIQKERKDFLVLRQGQVVIASGQTLALMTIQSKDKSKIKSEIERLMSLANYNAYLQVKPGLRPKERLLRIRKDYIQMLEEKVSDDNKWVVRIRSAQNVILGEDYFYVFVDPILSKNIVKKNDVIISKTFNRKELISSSFNRNIKILLDLTLAEIKRKGSFISDIQFDSNSIRSLRSQIRRSDLESIVLETISLKDSEIADQVFVVIRLNNDIN